MGVKLVEKIIKMKKMSMGGVEPPQLSPHAPQACMSTIPSHRHLYLIFITGVFISVARILLLFTCRNIISQNYIILIIIFKIIIINI